MTSQTGVPQIPYPDALEQAIAALPLPDEARLAAGHSAALGRPAASAWAMTCCSRSSVGRGRVGERAAAGPCKTEGLPALPGLWSHHPARRRGAGGCRPGKEPFAGGSCPTAVGTPRPLTASSTALLTSKLTGIPIMLGLLGCYFMADHLGRPTSPPPLSVDGSVLPGRVAQRPSPVGRHPRNGCAAP